MTYLDNGATSFPKPRSVTAAMTQAMETCANPGRGGYAEAMRAAATVLRCRERAGELFDCQPEQVVCTGSCTQGLNMAIRTLVKPGGRVVVSGFEHNAVVRPLHMLGAQIHVAGRKLFDPDDTLEQLEAALKKGMDAAVFTHVSNVFGYILPVEEMAALCRHYRVPFAVDCAQSAGTLPVSLEKWGADFIAMPGHKGLLGPMGTGLLLCGRVPQPLIAGGTGSQSESRRMPDFLPDVGEAGTVNVPGIAGLSAGLAYVIKETPQGIFLREQREMMRCAKKLEQLEKKTEEAATLKTEAESKKAEKRIEERLEAQIEKTLEKLTEKKTDLRRIHENILPDLAKKLLKNRSWSYAELYVKLLEQAAQAYEIPAFAIYTEIELIQQLNQRREQYVQQERALPEADVFFA